MESRTMTESPARPPRLSHERYCSEIVRQDGLLRGLLAGADDARTPVPTCPGWTLEDLAGHVDGNLRSLTAAVPTADGTAEIVAGTPADTTAGRCAAALRAAGPDVRTRMFGITWPTLDWARRAAHDLLIHRADAAGALHVGFAVEAEPAADALDELLTITADMTAPDGLSVRLIATDTGEEWHSADAPPVVTVRGPLTKLLLVVYRRLPAHTDHVAVEGDTGVLATWLDQVSLG
jgi:uncharacterized protein (TIGR03083 family)